MALFWDANAFQCGFGLTGHVPLHGRVAPEMIPPLI